MEHIFIHALREEATWPLTVVLLDSKEFLSTPSARRRPFHMTNDGIIYNISIHALREEATYTCFSLPLGGE